MADRIYNAQIILTEECNLRCAYCYMHNRKDSALTKKQLNEHIKTIREHTTKNDFDFYDVSVFGGEPLVELDKLMYLLTITDIDELCRNVYIFSNGLLVKRELSDALLLMKKVQFKWSFDGLANDKLRPIGDSHCPPSIIYKKKLKYLRSLTPQINMMISPDNLDLTGNYLYATETLKMLPKMGLVRDNIWSDEDVDKFEKEFQKLCQFLQFKLQYENAPIPGIIDLYIRTLLINMKTGKPVYDCTLVNNNGHSYSKKGVFPCARFATEDFNIKFDESLLTEHCKGCELENFCERGCYHQIYINKGPIKNLCKLYKIIFREIIELNKQLKSNVNWQKYIVKTKAEIEEYYE